MVKVDGEWRTRQGHRHVEAFCLMWYECQAANCGHRERIWNSRDGVTPFCLQCSSCGGDLQHVDWHADEYAPNHALRHRQKFWRDGTPAEAEAIMRRRIQHLQAHGKTLTPEQIEKRIDDMRIDPVEFTPGWPMLAMHDDRALS